MITRILFPLVLIVALLCSSAPVRSQPSTLEIPTILSLTGTAAFVGKDEAQALAAVEKFVNASGGVNGQSVHFAVADDGSNPVTAVQLTNQIMQQHPPLIMGSTFVATCGAMMPLILPNGPVQYCFSPGLNPPPRGYAFAGTASLAADNVAIFRFMRKRGYSRFAILSSTDATGQANDKVTADTVALPEFRGTQIVALEHFGPTHIAVTAQVQRVKAANPQAILIWASGPAFGTVLRGLHDAGVDLPMNTSGANANAEQLEQYGEIMPSNLFLPAFAYSLPPAVLQKTPMWKQTQDFFATFKSLGYAPSPAASPYVWDTAMIVISAFRKLGNKPTAQQLRDYILGIRNYMGMNGSYDFTTGDQHGLTARSVVFVRWDPQKKDFIPISGLDGVPL
jgi:branched-chain amino acid transport system substrate-binding protein